jgi:hypothetical protein
MRPHSAVRRGLAGEASCAVDVDIQRTASAEEFDSLLAGSIESMVEKFDGQRAGISVAEQANVSVSQTSRSSSPADFSSAHITLEASSRGCFASPDR